MICSAFVLKIPRRGKTLITPTFMSGNDMPSPLYPLSPERGQGSGKYFNPCLKRQGYSISTLAELFLHVE